MMPDQADHRAELVHIAGGTCIGGKVVFDCEAIAVVTAGQRQCQRRAEVFFKRKEGADAADILLLIDLGGAVLHFFKDLLIVCAAPVR